MSSFRIARTTAWLMFVIAVVACRPRSKPTLLEAVPSAWPRDEYCWWTSVSTPLPADSVSHRFSQAFASVGLTAIRSRRLGDTVLVRGGPTELSGARYRAVYASRMVAYQRDDTTRFRWYWSISPLVEPGATVAESTSLFGGGIAFCGEIGRVVAIKGLGKPQPTSEDSIAVWGRVP